MVWAVVAPVDLDGEHVFVVLGSCSRHRWAVKSWQEGQSEDGTCMVVGVETLRRDWQAIFGGLSTPVVGLQKATA